MTIKLSISQLKKSEAEILLETASPSVKMILVDSPGGTLRKSGLFLCGTFGNQTFCRRFTRPHARLLAAAIAFGCPGALRGANWINPNGGNWSDGTNWSTGTAPVNNVIGQFSLGSSTPYTVSGAGPFVSVQNDQVIINYNGGMANPDYLYGIDCVSVTSSTGQTSSLTLENGTILGDNPDMLGGTGGVSSLTLNSFSIENGLEGTQGLNFGGTSTAAVNFTQIGGLVESVDGGIKIGNTTGNANVTINGGTVETQAGGWPISFAGNLNFSSAHVIASAADVSFAGAGNISSSTISAGDYLCVGSLDLLVGSNQQAGYPPSIATSGGGTATLNMTNCTIPAGEGILVGCGGIGTLSVNGSSTSIGLPVMNAPLFYVGVSGVGTVHFSGGVQIHTVASWIGFNTGTGTVTVSGSGTSWITQGSPVNIQNGSVELDTNATWTDTTGGTINLSGGTLEVLSGARVHATNLDLSAGSTLEIGLDGSTSALNGQINIDAAAAFGGSLDVVLENGFQPTIGQQFQLFTIGSESGQFASVNLPATNSWDTSQLYAQGIITAVVPEPVGTTGILLLAVGLLRRRKLHNNE